MNDSAIELPRDRDKWIMQEFLRMGYTMPELIKLNRAQSNQQVLFLSDVVTGSPEAVWTSSIYIDGRKERVGPL